MKLLLIQGANMEYLGRRQPELYGTTTARELDGLLRRRAIELGVALDIFYTNTEGEAVSTIYKADWAGSTACCSIRRASSMPGTRCAIA